MAARQPIVVEVLRGPVVESIHQVMAVVVNEAGHQLQAWGNPQFLTTPRSSIKMLQALPLLESGAADKYQLDDEIIAMACSSHRGEKEHLAVLHRWFEKIGVSESKLICGPHLPFDEKSAHEMLRRGQQPTAVCNNCAGKHIALITTCLHLGEDPTGYEKYEHNAQKRLRKILSEVMRVDHSKVATGIDGCGLPTYAVPLQALATGMATFIDSKQSVLRKAALERIARAVRAYPHLIAGTDNFTTDVIEKTQGRVLLKSGAEGVFAGVIPEKKVAFALKAADGSARSAQMAAVYMLAFSGVLSTADSHALAKYIQPVITNFKGEPVGQIRIAKAV